MQKHLKAILFWLLAIILVAVVFWPPAGKAFLLFDDEEMFFNYKYFHPVNWGSWLPIWTHSFQGLYIPLTRSVWGLVVMLMQLGVSDWPLQSSPNPVIFLNITLHLANGFLVYKFLKFFIKSDWACELAVLFYLLHPLQVENLAWVMGGKELLWIFFGLISILFFQNEKKGPSVFFLILAVLCKPTAVVLPMLFMLYQYYRGDKLKNFRALLILQVLVGGIVFAYTRKTQQIASEYNVFSRMWMAVDTLGFYIKKMLFPVNLSADYGRTAAWFMDQALTFETSFAFVAIVAGVYIYARFPQVRKILILIAGLFMIPLLPFLGIIPFSFQEYSNVGDHYAAFSIVAATLVAALIAEKWPKSGSAFVVICALLCGIESWNYSQIWKNNDTFFNSILNDNPASFMAQNNLGIAAFREKKTTEAIVHFERATVIRATHLNSWINLAKLKAGIGDVNSARQIFASKAPQFDRSAQFHFEYGKFLWSQNDYAESSLQYDQAANLSPADPLLVSTASKAKIFLDQLQNFREKGQKK